MLYFLLFRIIPTILCLQLVSFFGGVHFVQGAARFIKTPPSVLYVSEGDNARFTWDYHVDDRLTEFDGFSPKWTFYEENATSSEGYYDIGFDNKFNGWAWEIASRSCPPRLLYPTTRVSKESTATLVISNVTTADSGIYGCSLVFDFKIPETEKTQLIVTVTPQINLDETKRVLENDNLTVTCSAIGPPTPNVTWKRSGSDEVLAFGVNGSAVLKIYNINRDQSGVYECQATNNPHVPQVKQTTMIIVQFPAEFDEGSTIKSVEAYLGQRNVKLKSVADGVPVPTHVWFLPNMKMVKSETSKKSTYTIEVVKEEHIGNWTISITKFNHGILSSYYVHRIEVVKGPAPLTSPFSGTCDHDYCTTGFIVGCVIGLIIAVLIIVVIIIVVVIYKKRKKRKNGPLVREKVLVFI